MEKRISNTYINYIIISFVVVLIIIYCKIMLKEYLMVSKYEPIEYIIKDEKLQIVAEEIAPITVYEDSSEFEIPEKSLIFINRKESIVVKDFITRSTLSRRDISIKKIIDGAYKNLGRPYIYGDIGVRGFDCSGLTYSLYLNNLGIKLPRTSSSLLSAGIKVNKADLKPGDIILFNTSGKGISHVGMYIGDGNMIHASSGKKKVVIEDINSKYFKTRYVTARRILQ